MIANFAKELNIKTVAEYVHSEQIFKVIKELDIDFAQGFYLGEPSDKLKF
jgi:EAL domain-containing protein (putative c-di-GMP-specific phosphodiesterase class I)